jgi:hypothetical protein
METLNDPLQDRVVKTVKTPPHRPLGPNLMYPDPSNFISFKQILLIR